MPVELENLARKHYENFPVGSFFIPRDLRKPIHLVYAFARVADDFADEGTDSQSMRLEKLDRWERMLTDGIGGKAEDNFFLELGQTIRRFSIPPDLFRDLLTAFRMDARNTTYETFGDLLHYCRHSANPIGRILLFIFNCGNEENFRLSDDICTALQLANFWQDISIDIHRNRFYIPREDFPKFEGSEDDIRQGKFSRSVSSLMTFQVQRTREIFQTGKPLITRVDSRLKFELKLIWNGGMRILEKIENQHYDTIAHRPALSLLDSIIMFSRALTTT